MTQRERGKYKHLYGTQRWRKQAKAYIAANPLCVMCSKRGRVQAATVCDHVNGHPANETEAQFWAGPFQSLCAEHHNSDKRREENGRPRIACDADGWPIT